MAALRYFLVTKVFAQDVQVVVQRFREVSTKPTTAISRAGVPKPILLHFAKGEPRLQGTWREFTRKRPIPQEPQVVNNLVVQLSELWFLAVEKKEWIDEKREITDERYVECAMGRKLLWFDVEEIGEVDCNGWLGFSCHHWRGFQSGTFSC